MNKDFMSQVNSFPLVKASGLAKETKTYDHYEKHATKQAGKDELVSIREKLSKTLLTLSNAFSRNAQALAAPDADIETYDSIEKHHASLAARNAAVRASVMSTLVSAGQDTRTGPQHARVVGLESHVSTEVATLMDRHTAVTSADFPLLGAPAAAGLGSGQLYGDMSWYSELLHDFISRRKAVSAGDIARNIELAKQARMQKKKLSGKANKGRAINMTKVHDNLVGYMPRTRLTFEPRVDEVMSRLFQTQPLAEAAAWYEERRVKAMAKEGKGKRRRRQVAMDDLFG